MPTPGNKQEEDGFDSFAAVRARRVRITITPVLEKWPDQEECWVGRLEELIPDDVTIIELKLDDRVFIAQLTAGDAAKLRLSGDLVGMAEISGNTFID